MMDFAAQQFQVALRVPPPNRAIFRPIFAFHKFAIVVFLGQFVATEKNGEGE